MALSSVPQLGKFQLASMPFFLDELIPILPLVTPFMTQARPLLSRCLDYGVGHALARSLLLDRAARICRRSWSHRQHKGIGHERRSGDIDMYLSLMDFQLKKAEDVLAGSYSP